MKKTMLSVSARAVEFILSRKLEELGNLTEETIALEVGVSLPYFLRNFKRTQKISLRDFITREKIQTAIFLLERQCDVFCGFVAIDPLAYRVLKRQNRPAFQAYPFMGDFSFLCYCKRLLWIGVGRTKTTLPEFFKWQKTTSKKGSPGAGHLYLVALMSTCRHSIVHD